jgi:preprotein translocase subunit YajC
MALERGDRVMFTVGVVGSLLRPWIPKGTEATVTKAGGWGLNPEVTLEDGTKLTVSKNKLSKIGGKWSWSWW